MQPFEQRSLEPTGLGSLRLIVTVLTVGSCVLGGAVIFSASRIGGKVIAEPSVPYVIAAIGLLVLVMQQFAVPRFISKAGHKPESEREPMHTPARSPGASGTASGFAGSQQPELEREKMSRFGTMVLVRAAMLEGAAVLHFIFYLFTQNPVLLVIGSMLIVALFFLRPSVQTYRAWCERLPTEQ